MRKILIIILLLCIVSCEKANIEEQNKLPEIDDVCLAMDDVAFMKYCYAECDINKDNKVSMQEAATFTELIIANKGITSLTGIEYFTNLHSLNCGNYEYGGNNNRITSLSLSRNTVLESLGCDGNPITSLDLSKNSSLKVLSCSQCQLGTLDISKNEVLSELNCSYNQLTSLNVSKCSRLEILKCNNNQLTAIELPNNSFLTKLQCADNQLPSLDISKCPLLENLYCKNNHISSLDFSAIPSLTWVNCMDNELTTLSINTTIGRNLFCGGNMLTHLDISKTQWECKFKSDVEYFAQKGTLQLLVNKSQQSSMYSKFFSSWNPNTVDKQLASVLLLEYNIELIVE